MRQWSVAEAKAKLSEVIDGALDGEAQEITKHGKPIAVMLDIEQYRRLVPVRSFKEHLLAIPPAPEDEREEDDPFRRLDQPFVDRGLFDVSD